MACRRCVPQFKALAQKYRGRVEFCAVSVLENDQNEVADFLKPYLGGFSVALDKVAHRTDRAGWMSLHWLDAAGIERTPSAFIVGRNGKIVWLGDSERTEPVLRQVLGGKWDVKKSLRSYEAWRTKRLALDAAQRSDPVIKQIDRIGRLSMEAKYQEALTQVAFLARMPRGSSPKDPKQSAAYLRALICFHVHNLQGFYAGVQEVFDVGLRDPEQLNNLAWKIVDPHDRIPERRWLLAISLAQRAVAYGGHRSGYLDTLAWAYYGAGKQNEAVSVEKEAAKNAEDLDEVEKCKAPLRLFATPLTR